MRRNLLLLFLTDAALILGFRRTAGTTAISGPPDLVEEIYQQVGYNKTDSTVPCDVNFQMSVVVAKKTFAINPIDWLGNKNGIKNGRCVFLLTVRSTLLRGIPSAERFDLAAW